MAPFLTDTYHVDEPSQVYSKPLSVDRTKKISDDEKASLRYEPGRTIIEDHSTYEHDWALPTFPDVHWPALTPVAYDEKGIRGDAKFARLFNGAEDVFDYTPKIGTEVCGVDLASLTDAQKDDLARLISTRGVVFFRDQRNLDIDKQRELGRYFGELHRHATTSVPMKPGYEDVHVVYTDSPKDQRAKFAPAFLWHSDVSLLLVFLVSAALCSSAARIDSGLRSRSGDLRGAAPLLHAAQASQRPASRWRR